MHWLTLGLKAASSFCKKWTIYLAAPTALIVAWEKLSEHVDPDRRQAMLLLAFLPAVCGIAFHGIPRALNEHRRRRLISRSVKGSARHPQYFRLYAYTSSLRDTKAFSRADGFHRSVCAWLSASTEAVHYLTGMSGTGKSSLVHSYVVPQLESSINAVVIRIPGSSDPLGSLRRELLKPRVIWVNKSDDPQVTTIELLTSASRHLSGRSLYIILDQFEEVLILSNLTSTELSSISSLLMQVDAAQFPNVRMLVVLRSDYIAALQGIEVPAIRHRDPSTWKEVPAFTEADSRTFLKQSKLDIGEKLMDSLIGEANALESTTGSIRPITLNLIGHVLAQRSVPSEHRAIHGRGETSLVVQYLRDVLYYEPIRAYSRAVAGELVTDAATRQPCSVSSIAEATSLSEPVVRSVLLSFSQNGVARCIAETDDIWELSHDFVARLVAGILATWRRSAVEKARQAAVPAALVCCLSLSGYIYWDMLESRRLQHQERLQIHEAALSTLEMQYGLNVVIEKNGTSRVAFAADNTRRIVSSDCMQLIGALLRVGSLELHFAHFEPNALTHIGKLNGLGRVDVSHSNIDATMLARICAVRTLVSLDASNTSMDDTAIAAVSGHSSLARLNIANTRISDSAISHIAGLSQLEVLDMSGTSISSRGLASVSELKHLKVLRVRFTKVDGSMLASLAACKLLEEVDLGFTAVGARTITALSSLTALEQLNLQATMIDSADMVAIGQLHKLQTLNIADTQVTDSGLRHVRSLTELRRLDVSNTATGDDGCKHCAELTSLESLNVSGTVVSSQWCVLLQKCQLLQELDVGNTGVDRLERIPVLPGLRVLTVGDVEITDAILSRIAKFPSLRTLRIAGTSISEEDLQVIREKIEGIDVHL